MRVAAFKRLQLSPCTHELARLEQLSERARYYDTAWVMETDLSSHLPDTVDELDEEGRALRVSVVLVTVTHALQTRKTRLSADVP